ncbi:hypothetical protein [Mesomycoplasma neurolyticum]|uniref:Uncharacterized protein n=1 Tax=Mesomycoplasma neurolyticum TaxID=2120 RepID=A0A449A4D2_9BACT|nr:hypothetical protein [Mesomycoplasma neurolyticum]VEU59140.1 Uncharacterised protein [Mesomycoplasma neurolyticum]
MKKKKITKAVILASAILLLGGSITAGVLLKPKNPTYISSTFYKSSEKEDTTIDRIDNIIEISQDEQPNKNIKIENNKNNKTKTTIEEKTEKKVVLGERDKKTLNDLKTKTDLKESEKEIELRKIEERLKEFQKAKEISPILKDSKQKLFYYEVKAEHFKFNKDFKNNFNYKVLEIQDKDKDEMILKIEVSDDYGNKRFYNQKFSDFITKIRIKNEIENFLSNQNIEILDQRKIKDKVNLNEYSISDFSYDDKNKSINVDSREVEITNLEFSLNKDSFSQNEQNKTRKGIILLKANLENEVNVQIEKEITWNFKTNQEYLDDIENDKNKITKKLKEIIDNKKLLPYQVNDEHFKDLKQYNLFDETINYEFVKSANVNDYQGKSSLIFKFTRGDKSKDYTFGIDTKHVAEPLEEWSTRTQRDEKWEISASSYWEAVNTHEEEEKEEDIPLLKKLWNSVKKATKKAFAKPINSIQQWFEDFRPSTVFDYGSEKAYWKSKTKDKDEEPYLTLTVKNEDKKAIYVYGLEILFFPQSDYFKENSYKIEYQKSENSQWIETTDVSTAEEKDGKNLVKAIIKNEVYAIKISFPKDKAEGLQNRSIYAVMPYIKAEKK